MVCTRCDLPDDQRLMPTLWGASDLPSDDARDEYRLLSARTAFSLERLVDILDVYREDCRRNDNVSGMQRATRSILEMLASKR